MSRYLEILSVQRPFPIGVDENQREMFSVNFNAVAAAPVNQFEEELAKVVIDAGLATAIGTDVFLGPKAVLPTGNGPYIQFLDSGGTSPDQTHNGDKYERLSVQVVIRAKSTSTGRTRALAVWRALEGLHNTTLSA